MNKNNSFRENKFYSSNDKLNNMFCFICRENQNKMKLESHKLSKPKKYSKENERIYEKEYIILDKEIYEKSEKPILRRSYSYKFKSKFILDELSSNTLTKQKFIVSSDCSMEKDNPNLTFELNNFNNDDKICNKITEKCLESCIKWELGFIKENCDVNLLNLANKNFLE